VAGSPGLEAHLTAGRAPAMRHVAVVTGAASGIGRATVELFLAQATSVLATDLNEASGERLLAEHAAPAEEGSLVFVRADVSREEDVAAAVDAADRAFGRVDRVVKRVGERSGDLDPWATSPRGTPG
jgi:NAD(P)-dependent dehydrogenase (short-subunit alcohol dehydrogenase family)